MMKKTYSEMIMLPTYDARFKYLLLQGAVGKATFGADRYLNQVLYHSDEWDSIRDKIIIRDNGCDLAHPDYQIGGRLYIHHINPITKEDVINRSDILFDPDNLVCVSFNTHQAIHYGDANYLMISKPAERFPYDTSPWRLHTNEQFNSDRP